MGIWSKFMVGLRAFREAYTKADIGDVSLSADWNQYDARMFRYDFLRSFYMGDTYTRNVNMWSQQYMAAKGLYKFTRPLYNPAFELAQFYRDYVWNGQLEMYDDSADLYASASGGLPIGTDNDALRVAIAHLWQASNWTTKRKLMPLYGAMLGDVALEVVDSVAHGKVSLRIVPPSHIADVDLDDAGNVKAYILQYKRTDDDGIDYTYSERVERNGDSVIYRTFKNDVPFAWGNESAEWEIGYGFVPMIICQHHDIGLKWGQAEMQPKVTLFAEIDDAASKLNDQIRKTVDAKWVALGARKPISNTAGTPNRATANETEAQRQSRRDDSPILYIPDENARLEPVVAPLDLMAGIENVRMMQSQLEKIYPELSLYRLRSGGAEISGRAVRYLRQDAEGKVRSAREIYDGALVRAQQMAIAIGGWRGYDGYSGFSLDSYDRGELNHRIGKRPVFADDELDKLEISEKRATIFSVLSSSSTVPAAAKVAGYSDDEIADLQRLDVEGVEQ